MIKALPVPRVPATIHTRLDCDESKAWLQLIQDESDAWLQLAFLMEVLDHCLLYLQAVRQKKLSEMEAEGIPAKYRAELARKKMTNW